MENFEKSLSVAGLFSDRINRFLDGIADEIKQSLSHSLQIYTQNSYNKISKVKTFIYREGSVDFDSIYFPVGLSFGKQRIEVPSKVETLFQSCNYLTILGHAGSGKTMLMRHCFLSILKSQTHIPVVIELRDLNRYEGNFYEYIGRFVFSMKLVANEKIFNRLMDSGEFVFFFDGYDELNLDSKEQRTREISELVDRFPNNYYMLTSRPDAEAEALERFENYHICPLSQDQIQAFIHQQMKLISDGLVMEDKMVKAIQTAGEGISAYLSNPLLLSMFILTFGYHPAIPSKKTEFYFNVFDTLYTKHDSVTKGGGFAHDKACKLERSQYVEVLQWLCYRTYFKQEYQFSRSLLQSELSDIRDRLGYDYDNDKMIYDLTVAISILIQDGLDYIFPHRSMQEYFAAQLISGLPEHVRIKKVYNNVFFVSSLNQNLWSLCQEINEYEFLSNFVANHLNKVIASIEKVIKRKKDQAKALLEYIIKESHPQIHLNDSNELGTISYQEIEHSRLLLFYSHQDISMMSILVEWLFANKQIVQKIYSSHFTCDGLSKLKKLDVEVPLFLPTLLEQGVHTRIFEQYKKIREITNSLNESLNYWDNNNEKLLDL